MYMSISIYTWVWNYSIVNRGNHPLCTVPGGSPKTWVIFFCSSTFMGVGGGGVLRRASEISENTHFYNKHKGYFSVNFHETELFHSIV